MLMKPVFEYYCAFMKQIKPLSPEPQLSDVYHPSEGQKSGKLLFFTVVAALAEYAPYKYFK